MQTLTLTRPDDWHVHFRDQIFLKDTVAATAKHFARALVMPNLKPALTTASSILAYRERILAVLDNNSEFIPFMTLYLNEEVSIHELQKLKQHRCILGAKLYPAGATTNSEEGVRSFRRLYPLFEEMQKQGLVLQIHGEVVTGDIFAREAAFIQEHLLALIEDFPNLRVVLEHISTREAVEFVTNAPANLAATITPHHLYYNRNQMLAAGIKPHYYCLPILKTETDQLALQAAAVSGNAKFFAGTDSAPHAKENKENACGCAGIYSAPYAIVLYTELFDKLGQLDKLDAFLGRFGAQFYRLPLNQSQLKLCKQPQTIPKNLPLGESIVIPMAAGEALQWSVYEQR